MLVIPMSTAIVRMYVTDGFIVAADGRKYDSENHLILSDTAQKIFSIDSPGKSLAYSLTGVIGLGPNDSEDLGFNFEKEIAQAVTTARTSTEKTLDAYARVLARYITQGLTRCAEIGKSRVASRVSSGSRARTGRYASDRIDRWLLQERTITGNNQVFPHVGNHLKT